MQVSEKDVERAKLLLRFIEKTWPVPDDVDALQRVIDAAESYIEVWLNADEPRDA